MVNLKTQNESTGGSHSMNQKADYANWISKKILVMIGIITGIFIGLFVCSLFFNESIIRSILQIIFLCGALIGLGFFCYMFHARQLLSYKKGGIQGKILDIVLNYLQWNGDGNLLDIGCGSGAMAIKASKKFPNAMIVGVDYWGIEWDFAQEQCIRNAQVEGVEKRITFQKEDASKLTFSDNIFDAAVSNFVFHEVKTQPDKIALIQEALRVIKPGGSFSFQDIFFSKSHYPDLKNLIAVLSSEVSELHFVDTRKNDVVPKFLRTPMVAGNMGLIYGIK